LPDLGVRLQLLIGPVLPVPVSYPVIDSLREVEVTCGQGERDGFQLTFALGKDSLLDYSLLLSGLLDPPSRVIVMVFVNMLPTVLIDGIITRHELQPTNRPGETRLVVSGVDISVKMDLKEKSKTYPNRPDSLIVLEILKDYFTLGIVPDITPTTDVPIELDRIPSQQGTDLQYVRQLARHNGFVFYVDTTPVPGVTTAHWGPDLRAGIPQSALTMNMGSDTNVDKPMNFSFDSLGPVQPDVSFVDPILGLRIAVPLPTSLHPPLSRSPAPALRTMQPRDAANIGPIQAALKAVASATESSDALKVTGEVDATRYGGVLKARGLVGVRGVGQGYDGLYYVQTVSHKIRKGEYKQNFTLVREGRGTLTPLLIP
jgi:hypothetical protein